MPAAQRLALAAALLAAGTQAQYNLVSDFTASNFWSSFTFFTGADPTEGFVDYLSQSAAESLEIISTSGNQVYLGVDWTSNYATNSAGRPSVRLSSNQAYTQGLFIGDFAHIPGGQCGSWPAFWTFGPNWPNNGEIDIIEGINSFTYDTTTLHTSDGCTVNGAGQTDQMLTSNCYQDASGENGSGCGMKNPNSNSYGAGFNNQGGGIYAMEWTDSAISVWMFPRGSIPSDITNGAPNPSGWGTPNANFGSGSCDIASHFADHNIILDTTFCGQWAGAVWSSDSTCAPLADSCVDYVANNPSAFQYTYWLINSIKVYQTSSGSPNQNATLAAEPKKANDDTFGAQRSGFERVARA